MPGEQRSLEVLALFNDGTAANIADTLTWTVAPSAIADITGADLTAVGNGVGTVTATEPTTSTPLSVALTVGRYADLVVDGAPLSLFETDTGSPADPLITVNDDPLGGGQRMLVRWQYEPALSHYAHELILSLAQNATIFTTAGNSLSVLDVEPDVAYTAKAGGSSAAA